MVDRLYMYAVKCFIFTYKVSLVILNLYNRKALRYLDAVLVD